MIWQNITRCPKCGSEANLAWLTTCERPVLVEADGKPHVCKTIEELT